MLRQNKIIVRNLSKDFGRVAAVYRTVENTHDILTGAIARDYDVHIIKRIIPMPFIVAREFITQASFTANKNYAQGGYFTTDKRTVIVEQRNLDILINEQDHIVFDDKRYEVIKCEHAEELASTLVTVKSLQSVDPFTDKLMAHIANGWTYNKDLTAFAMDELALSIRFDLFGGSVPTAFRCLPFAGKEYSDALLYLYGTGSLSPSTAVEAEYKEYGIGGGIDNADIMADTGLAYTYGIRFAAGGVVLTAPQQTILNTIVENFSLRLGRQP